MIYQSAWQKGNNRMARKEEDCRSPLRMFLAMDRQVKKMISSAMSGMTMMGTMK